MMQKTLLFYILLVICFYMSYSQTNNEDNIVNYNDIERYIYSPNQDKTTSKELYRKLTELSKKNDARAFYYLGLLQKEGIGKKLI